LKYFANIRVFHETTKFWNSENKEMPAFHLLSREKIRLFVKFWNSENKEMPAFHLLSREKIRLFVKLAPHFLF